MHCGLYGKLPSKRDFIAVGTPRDFLKVWEPWMQASISASRQTLGDGWQNAFLTAPIWRFWLGAEICGTTIVGAFMPSMDGIGRYYPLTLIAYADEGETIPPPELDAQNYWFKAAEECLLSALDGNVTFETVIGALEKQPYPSAAPPTTTKDMIPHAGGQVARIGADQPLSEVLAAMRLADHAKAYGGSTFWWTIGGEDFGPVVLSSRRMPDPFLYTEMLTGRFAFGFD